MALSEFRSPITADLAASTKHLTTTTDSNLFPPEVNKIVTKGIPPRKYWIVCDGEGRMYGRRIEDPIETLERIAKLLKDGLITEEEYQRMKTALLGLIAG